MSIYNGQRHFLGVLAEEGDHDANLPMVTYNGTNWIYFIKILSLIKESHICGFQNSFANPSLPDLEFLRNLPDPENHPAAEARFRSFFSDKLFVFQKKDRTGKYIAPNTMYPVKKPDRFDPQAYYHSIPVFFSKDSEPGRYLHTQSGSSNLFSTLDCQTPQEAAQSLSDKSDAGKFYGLDAQLLRMASFVIWIDSNDSMYAIGYLKNAAPDDRYHIKLEFAKLLTPVNIDKYRNTFVYSPDLNPSLLFMPDQIFCRIRSDLIPATDENFIRSMQYYCYKNHLSYGVKDLMNVHTAIKCSSLIILSGLSGTGKSSIVDMYAETLGADLTRDPEENQRLFIPIRPSWNDDSDLLGYADPVGKLYRASESGLVSFLKRASEEPDKLFIVCLDEMNLARPEHYFSQFLSLLERPAGQRYLYLYDRQYEEEITNSDLYPHRIHIGENVKFIGTVNIDESTYHFSGKVLDRANVIQLEIQDYSRPFPTLPETAEFPIYKDKIWTMTEYRHLLAAKEQEDPENHPYLPGIHKLLWELHTALNNGNPKFGIGWRVVRMIDHYLCNLPKTDYFGEEGLSFQDGLDLQIAQRVLTKVRGPENQLKKILGSLEHIFLSYKEEGYSEFRLCLKIVKQKQEELTEYGYCI